MNTPITKTVKINGLTCKILQQDWEIYGYVIPKGFCTDGVSFVYKNELAEAAGVLHDYLVEQDAPLRKARQLFRRKLREDGVSRWYITLLTCLLFYYDHMPKGLRSWLRRIFLPNNH